MICSTILTKTTFVIILDSRHARTSTVCSAQPAHDATSTPDDATGAHEPANDETRSRTSTRWVQLVTPLNAQTFCKRKNDFSFVSSVEKWKMTEMCENSQIWRRFSFHFHSCFIHRRIVITFWDEQELFLLMRGFVIVFILNVVWL